jgi:UrcA family protein
MAMYMRSSSIILAVALLSASLSAASADEVEKNYTVVVYSSSNTLVRTQVVTYGDLNITTAAGEAAFRARVAGAIDKVCGGPSIFVRDLIENMDLRACHTRSMADAMPQVQMVVDDARHVASVASSITAVPIGN